ncbi:MAG: hypothetical protein JXA10_06795 [Anaerolineae bacterium]|nr:hypothetical protein [Anaerolineae bacterium]
MGIIAAALTIAQAELDTVGIIALTTIIIGLMVTVANSTMAIWGFQSDEKPADNDQASRAKTKNIERSRVERLIEDLNDDEIYDLETLLLARDGDQARDRSSDGEFTNKHLRL